MEIQAVKEDMASVEKLGAGDSKFTSISLGENKILDKNCNIYKQGKNWYCEIDNIKITINSYSYTIITAHLIK